MKTLQIYNLIAMVIIVFLSWYCFYLLNKLNDTLEVLNQCETAYYKETGILPK